jgi:pilus assembly protein CpaB
LVVLRIAAISFAIIAVFIGVIYLRFAGDDAHTVPVVVAAQDIPAGTRITADMLTVVDIPPEDFATGALSDTEPMIDQVTKVAVAEREQVTDSKIIRSGPPRPCGGWGSEIVSDALGASPGSEALTLVGIETYGEQLSAGDRVDVLFQGGDAPVVTPVVQNVELLCVEQQNGFTDLTLLVEDGLAQRILDSWSNRTRIRLSTNPRPSGQ